MAERPRFYLDVHIHNAVFEALKREGIDVVRGQDVLGQGAGDEAHLKRAAELGRVLVSRDMDFLRLGYSTEGHAGVIRVRRRTSIAGIIEAIVLADRSMTAEEMIDSVENW